MRILIEDLLKWDPIKQKPKGKGIVGTVLSFAPADEEQGRKTLHSHWQIWMEELSQELRDAIFDRDTERRFGARHEFLRLVDSLMSASFGNDFEVRHDCEPSIIDEINTQCEEKKTSDDHFVDREEQVFRNARNKHQCRDLEGRILQCKYCDSPVSTSDIVNLALESWRQMANDSGSNIHFGIPFKPERLDIAAYRYSYDMDRKCIGMTHPFWGNKDVRDTVLHLTFDEHDWHHRPSCHKKGVDCRFFLPELTQLQTGIYEDPDKGKTVIWHRLVQGDTLETPSWLLEQRRPMGCQYINTHCKAISEVFNCNTNIQIGDRSQVFYSTLYCGKSTQKEDSERVQRINTAVNKRLLCIQQEVLSGERSKEEIQQGFVEGLCRMLSAMNAATTRNVISSTMAHLLVCNGGSRFRFSHGFGNLLIGQLEATLEGRPVDVRIRVNVFKGEKTLWQDSSSDDYLHRPDSPFFNSLCAYEMCMHYKKTYKSKKEVAALSKKLCGSNGKQSQDVLHDDTDTDEDEEEDFGVDDYECYTGQGYQKKKFAFKESHPGNHFSHLAKLKKWVIPKVYIPEDKLCRVEHLKLAQDDVEEETRILRENYAKIALLMFYPHRELRDLTIDNSYWTLFAIELNNHRDQNDTSFWKQGFQILQNIEDRMTMDQSSKRATDRVTNNTECCTPEDQTGFINCKENEFDGIDDILDYCQSDG